MRRLYLFIGLSLTCIGHLHAQQIPDGCVIVEQPRKISNMCDFKDGVVMYATRIARSTQQGCPRSIDVEYADPQTRKPSTLIVDRKGTIAYSCSAGIDAAHPHRQSVVGGSPSARVPTTSSRPGLQATAPQAAPPPAKRVRWNAGAASLWNSSDGQAHVAIGYSGGHSTASAAMESAIAECVSAGGTNCKVTGGRAWNSGCYYLTTGSSGSRTSWSSGPTSAKATQHCREGGMSYCKPPIGGCVD